MTPKDNGNEQQHTLDIVVVMVPLPAQGHLNQLLHLSHLINSYHIPVHYTGPSTHNHIAKLRIQGWSSESLSKIHFHDFKLPPFNSPPPTIDPSIPYPKHFDALFEASTHLREPVFNLIQELSRNFRKVIVIHDVLMASVVQDVKLISNAEKYDFTPISAFCSFTYRRENLYYDDQLIVLKKDFPEIENVPSNDGCMTQEQNELASNQIKCLGFESGSIFNTSRVIEGKYVQFLEKIESKITANVKFFALGPFNPINIVSKIDEKRHECLKWLDRQEDGSVLYVSFGSTTSLTDEQIEELANGLERSREKFIWVLRRADPNDVLGEADRVERPKLSEGYEDRVKGRGLIVRDWAPQLEILAHRSVGGFMSHCGWNSCLESISMGVPILAWPMHSDQPRNAVLVTDVLRIGVLVRGWEHREKVVNSSRIEGVVKTLMGSKEGMEMRKRAKELGDEVRRSFDEGGVSWLERDSFIAHISR
ncbi:zeatin O-glucosyltransferase-like [Amaranthus tricolor]|uniref:zeatin O-glucosyltransferase-like n=1 Tax=Amaranthus tricolor TaxID=29722 RepID=UPI002590EA8E|nr:zeatin O-glucosyltransferase-like [Amaranthus tricolor]